jgi:hypothetical protein
MMNRYTMDIKRKSFLAFIMTCSPLHCFSLEQRLLVHLFGHRIYAYDEDESDDRLEQTDSCTVREHPVLQTIFVRVRIDDFRVLKHRIVLEQVLLVEARVQNAAYR